MIAALRNPQPLERSPEQIRTARLIAALSDIPPEFVLTPTSRKIPIRPGWQRENLSRDEVAQLLQSGGWVKRSDGSSYRQQYDGIALIIPQPYVVVDIDGKTAHKLFCEITGQTQPDKTVAWGSGKPHNGSLLYRLPDALVARIAKLPGSLSKLRLTECPTWKTAGSDGIELLLPGSRATIPPSAHLETSGYEFKLGWDFGIQPAPDWVVQAIEAEVQQREYRAAHPFTPRDWSEIEVEDIRKALEFLNPDCGHDDWVAIGMALHSTGNADYLDLWEEWSCQSHKYKAGECEQRWDSFRADGGIGLGRLFALAGIRITTARLPSQGFALLPGGQTEAEHPSDRDRLIAKRMFTFRSNYKAATDRAFHLSDHPEVDTTWYQGWQFGDPLSPQLCAQTILIRGGLGSGKTEATLRVLAQVAQDRQIIWITARRNLNRNTEARAQAIGLEVYNYQDDVATFRWMLRTGQPGLFMFCLEGLSDYHTQTIDWSKAIVVVDEFSGVRAEAPASKPGVFAEYERCLREAGTLLALDAHLSDLDLDILEMYRGDFSRHLYRQVAQSSTWNVNWAECRTKAGELSLSHDGIGYSWVESELAAGFRLAIPADCKLMAKTLALHCQQLGYPVALATSETVEFNGRFFPIPINCFKTKAFER
ncbi:MAG: hypothetical protein HC772_17505 [Leptolyngbyaceae cyanobacterium CRU_2_3]|nr:hypothetical protein [Leptolyngbyaceae cyanobacterium CRU_2_3]